MCSIYTESAFTGVQAYGPYAHPYGMGTASGSDLPHVSAGWANLDLPLYNVTTCPTCMHARTADTFACTAAGLIFKQCLCGASRMSRASPLHCMWARPLLSRRRWEHAGNCSLHALCTAAIECMLGYSTGIAVLTHCSAGSVWLGPC